MLLDRLIGQVEIRLGAATGSTLAAGYRAHIAVLSGAGVLPAERVNILAATKEAPDQRDLLGSRGGRANGSVGCRCWYATVHSRRRMDRWKALRETQQRPQALVLTAQTLDFARGPIEPVLEIAFGHARIRRALYVPPLSALPTLCRQVSEPPRVRW